MTLEKELVEVLLLHAGERQNDEGAVDCLKRIIAERDAAFEQIAALSENTAAAMVAVKEKAARRLAKAAA